MAANSSVINVAILADTKKFQKAMGKAGGSLADFSKKAAMGVAAVGGAVVAMGLSVNAQMETMRNNIISGTGASGEALDGLIESARQVGQNVPQSFDEVSTALADVNTAFGTTGKDLEEQTKLFLDFSRAAGVDASSAISNVDAALTQFGETDADEALGDLLRVAQATGRPMEDLLSNVKTFGPVFANMGFSLEETTALMGQLAQGGVDVTRIAPGLNKFSRTIADMGGDPKAALEDTVNLIKNAASDVDGLSIATEAFGAEGAQRMSSAIRSGNFDLENFSGLLGDGTGLVGEQSAEMLTLSDKISILKNKGFAALMPIVEKVIGFVEELSDAFSKDGLAGAVDLLKDKLKPVTNWMKKNKPILAGIATLIGVVMVASIYTAVAALAAKATAWYAVNSAMLIANIQFVAIAVAVAAVAAGLVWAYQNVGFFRTAVDKMKEAAVIAFDWLKDHVPPIIEKIIDIFKVWIGFHVTIAKKVWEMSEVIRVVIAKVLNFYIAFYTAAWEVAKQVGKAVSSIIEFFTSLPSDLKTKFGEGFQFLKDKGGEAKDWLKEHVIDKIVGFITGIPDRVGDVFGMIFGGMGDAFKTGVNALIGLLNDFSFSWDSKKVGIGRAAVTVFPGGSFDPFDITPLAKGGIVSSPTLAMIGEGSEPEAVIPLSKLRNMGGGGTLNVTVNMPAGSNGDDVVRALQDYQRRRGAIPVATGTARY